MNICLQILATKEFVPDELDFITWVNLAYPDRAKEVVLRVVDIAEIKAINHSYRNKNQPTNVLSFEFDMPDIRGNCINVSDALEPHSFEDLAILGDVVLCASVINQEARIQGKTPLAHWAHLTIHGILHLQGFDHIEPIRAAQMEQVEIKLLKKIGISNPYL